MLDGFKNKISEGCCSFRKLEYHAKWKFENTVQSILVYCFRFYWVLEGSINWFRFFFVSFLFCFFLNIDFQMGIELKWLSINWLRKRACWAFRMNGVSFNKISDLDCNDSSSPRVQNSSNFHFYFTDGVIGCQPKDIDCVEYIIKDVWDLTGCMHFFIGWTNARVLDMRKESYLNCSFSFCWHRINPLYAEEMYFPVYALLSNSILQYRRNKCQF